MNENYQLLDDTYYTINFREIEEEMDEHDKDDFHTLFEVRDILPKLKIAIDNYGRHAENNNYLVFRDYELANAVRDLAY